MRVLHAHANLFYKNRCSSGGRETVGSVELNIICIMGRGGVESDPITHHLRMYFRQEAVPECRGEALRLGTRIKPVVAVENNQSTAPPVPATLARIRPSSVQSQKLAN